jgi:hypothetical protein
MSNTGRIAIPYMSATQAGKELTFNNAMKRIDATVNLAVSSRTTTAPPGTPENGEVFLVPASATGAWAGMDGKLAFYNAGWEFLTPVEGWRCWVVDDAEEIVLTDTGWVQIGGLPATGWEDPTGTQTRTTFDTSTVTLPQLAERLAALIADLKDTGRLTD